MVNKSYKRVLKSKCVKKTKSFGKIVFVDELLHASPEVVNEVLHGVHHVAKVQKDGSSETEFPEHF